MMVSEERKVATAVHREKERIAQGIEIIMHVLQQRGRLIVVGAGSSGRLVCSKSHPDNLLSLFGSNRTIASIDVVSVGRR